MEGRCQCGSVTFRTPQEKPLKWFVCHCLECRRQSASAFGISAIFPNFDLLGQDPGGTDDQATGSDTREEATAQQQGNSLVGIYEHSNTTSGRAKTCYYCKACGTRIMNLSVVPGSDGKGGFAAVKGGCLEGINKDILSGATHIWTSRALMPVPEGAEQYERDPPPRT